MAEKSKKVSPKEWAKAQTGGGFEPTAIKLPQGVEYYKPDPGPHTVDFMPYVAGKFNPRADEGYTHFELQYSVHRVQMPNGNPNSYCCLWDCFKKPCPICQFIKEKSGSENQDLIKSLKVQTRHLWIVNDEPGNKKNKLKVFDTNHYAKGFGFGEMMVDAITEQTKCDDFSDLEDGMSVRLTVKEDSFPGKGGQIVKFNKVTKVVLVARDYTYPAEMLEHVTKQICLDDCLIQTSYADLKKCLNQDDSSSSSGEEEQRQTHTKSVVKPEASKNGDSEKLTKPAAAKKEPVADDFGLKVGTFVIYEGEECEIKKISGDGTSLTLEDEDGEMYKAVSPSEVRKVKVKEDEQKSVTKVTKEAAKTAKKPVVEDDEEDEDSELEDEDSELEDEDEEPVVAKKASKKPSKPIDDDEDLDDD